jgi:2-polyprenyl-3-methyl-5-hydroxy-6-metoxy-1,4-benzoquinol methylase
MALREDPEQNEDRALARLIPSFRGLRVLEIGAGDGRITRKFADLAASVIAIDPKAQDIAALHAALPRVDSRPEGIDDLQLPLRSVDIAIFSWSL